jgi:hypothetical protein
MFPVVYPALAFLGLAILSDLGEQKVQRHRKSIEACTAEVRAMWVKEDGVLRVYHEVSSLNCAQIVVECSNPPRQIIPGEYGGYPLRVKYGYGESTLGRIPTHLWNTGGMGIRGEPRSWRDSEPRYGASYGVITGPAGIRGVGAFRSYTAAQLDAIRRDEAAQGLRASSVAPPA